ncbi:heme-Cu protein NnrS [Vibrio sp. UCD-FRSSP16_10]|uniref:NnrS family protein n=1 Tax=unclassified Vibrio TaxID=2614977 RepID=UPI0007FC95DB|nr:MULTISPECIES: NnrS family protein [unclassified Vibrio]OBT12086.1 heme-Cu protein NnrS [Vibrio sp. UCD-FRSSP16_30]OBT20417.1 heme-Cu protein NnrS [Vibrio sp. UCD-FRSSP16_10]
MNNSDKNQNNSPSVDVFFELAFRPFFLCASIFSIAALVGWAAFWNGSVSLNVYGGVMWWHMHEMLFGFAATVVVGFLLTAVQNWTGVRSINGGWLMLMLVVWLIARIVMFLPDLFNQWFIAAIDLLFLIIALVSLASNVISVKLWRNFLFVPILFFMILANGVMHYSVLFQKPLLMMQASTTMVLLITLIMCIMGGRVFPMFTANGTQTPKTEPILWLENLSISSAILAVALNFQLFPVPPQVVAGVFILSGLANAYRAIRWKVWVAYKTPLVWTLHVSYWAVALGLILFGMSLVSPTVTQSQAVHSLTVGGMGVMILSMISRVSLGHTGRVIVIGKVMTAALVAIIFAFLVRVFGGYFVDNIISIITLSSVLWVFAYSCFVVLYLPILIKPRD